MASEIFTFRRFGLGDLNAKEIGEICQGLDSVQKKYNLNRADAVSLLVLTGAVAVSELEPVKSPRLQELLEEIKQWLPEIKARKSAEKAEGFLYFVKAHGNLFKIGVTKKSPLKRLPMIQTGCPYKIELHAALYYEDRWQREREFHRWLAPYRTQGEWYEIDESILEELIIQEITKSYIALDQSPLMDVIAPAHVLHEAERRLVDSGFDLRRGAWCWDEHVEEEEGVLL